LRSKVCCIPRGILFCPGYWVKSGMTIIR
jgi:hypothetical protein